MAKISDILSELDTNHDNSESLAATVMNYPQKLDAVMGGISSENARVKFRSVKVLRIISEKDPKLLYSRMDFFVGLLDSENKILKWNSIEILSNLATVDTQKRFDRIFKKFYGLLHEGSLITAAHVVDNSGKIANAKLRLRGKITGELLKVEKVRLPTEECRNILLRKTILTFDEYFDKIQDKNEVISFVRRQLNNSRKSTRAKAEKFLKFRLKQLG